jgi:hypothetical protein
MQRPLFGGHRPINLSAKTVYETNTSDSGNFLGRNIVRSGLQSAYQWKYLEDTWMRDYFGDFRQAARTTPFFIAWRPADYPTEVVFGWSPDDIAPENMGAGAYMSVGFSVTAYGDV